MTLTKKICSGAVLALLMISPAAFAHQGHDHHHWYSGLLHPLTGIDHLLTFLLMGVLLANQAKSVAGKSTVALMAAFGVGALASVTLPATLNLESVLLVSPLVLFVLLVLKKLPGMAVISASAMAIFGMSHGYVLNLEATQGMSHLTGMMASSAMLVAAGFVAMKKLSGNRQIVFG